MFGAGHWQLGCAPPACAGLDVDRFGGAVAGFLLLITARGNYNRASFYSDYESLLTRYAVRFLNCLNMLKEHALPLLFAFAVLFVLLCYQCLERRCAKGLLWPVIFLLGGLAANFAMVLSPDYYERSTHGPFTLITAACAACLVQLEGRSLRRALACGTACLGIVCGIHMLEAGYDIASYSVMYNTRDALLRTEAAAIAPEEAGSTVLESYAIEPYTHWCAAYGLPDIRENTEDSIGCAAPDGMGLAVLLQLKPAPIRFPATPMRPTKQANKPLWPNSRQPKARPAEAKSERLADCASRRRENCTGREMQKTLKNF